VSETQKEKKRQDADGQTRQADGTFAEFFRKPSHVRSDELPQGQEDHDQSRDMNVKAPAFHEIKRKDEQDAACGHQADA